MKWLKTLLLMTCAILFTALVGVTGLYLWIAPTLPSVDSLKSVQLQTPMRIYSNDGKLMSQFGEKRRIPLRFDQVPTPLINAVLATEDARFFEHKGVDPIGVIRAAVVLVSTGKKSQGASTITMQVARNFFLSREKTYIRKIKEIFLALEIERLLTKKEILELYLNRSFLGNRAYGVGAAAQVYYGKSVSELSLSEMAMIAGLPQAPSAANPIRNPERALNRRNLVLSRMKNVGYISEDQYEQATSAPLTARYHGATIELYAPYIAEMARDFVVERYGQDAAYTQGFRIITTANAEQQLAAQQALLDNLFDYDRRHGYRGPVAQLWQTTTNENQERREEENDRSPETTEQSAVDEALAWTPEQILAHLEKVTKYKDLEPGVVVAIDEQTAKVLIANGDEIELPWQGLSWARTFINDSRQGDAPKQAQDILSEGAQIWIRYHQEHWWLAQVPEVSSAIVAMDPTNGAVRALVGGYDFGQSQYNRITQAKRQLGSNIKPYLYSVALEQGFTLASLVNNAPINQWDRRQGTAWRPKNSPDVYTGPTRIRQGLAQSINVMAVRTLRQVGIDNFINQLGAFGFDAATLPRNESLSLGSASVTPMENVRGFSAFANGGFLVDPYFIDRIEDSKGKVLFQHQPRIACSKCLEDLQSTDDVEEAPLIASCPWPHELLAPRVISEQNAFLIKETLKSVIWGGGDWERGTGWNGTAWRAARLLKRRDIGGKTGTTNEARDTWFTGFGPNLVATAWVGFDDHGRKLGRTRWNDNGDKGQIVGGESGAKSAGPAWNYFMHSVLKDVPEQRNDVPAGIVTARIDMASGKLSNRTDETSRFEYFIEGTQPTELASSTKLDDPVVEQETTEELF